MKKFFLATLSLMVIFTIGVLFVALPLYISSTLPEHVWLTDSEFSTQSPIYLPKTKFLHQSTNFDSAVGEEAQRHVDLKLFGILPIRRVKVDLLPFENVIAGGHLIGFNAKVDGIIVTADSKEQGLKKGDVIVAVNDVTISSLAEFEEVIKVKTGRVVILVTLYRGGKKVELPVRVEDGSVGVWLKDETTGVGTLTYVNPVNNNFASLGHKLNDFETSTSVNLRGGTVHSTSILGFNKGEGKKIGSYKSLLEKPQGDILSSNEFGVFGCLYSENLLVQGSETLPVASRYNVRPGKAKIRTTLADGSVGEFDCEIIKTRFQKKPSTRSMLIRITDRRLLEDNGGIVHGMSGSPIIQNGKIVGALTHVVVGNSARGYGIYIDFIMP